MKIKTIADLQKASKDEVKEAIEYVSIMKDLEEYLSWLVDSETTTIVTTELKRYSIRSLGVHPSSACKKDVCLLKIYYECTGEMERMRAYEPETQRIWDIGTLLHDTYQAHLRNMWPDQFRDEVSLNMPKYMVKSHTDGIFDFSLVKSALEMKSIKDGGNFGWEKVQAKPMEDNVRQGHFYMKASDSPFCIVLYIAKNTGKLKEHVVPFDQSIWDDIENNVLVPVIQAVKLSTTPEANAGYHCRWCDFNHSCPAVRKERSNAKRPRAWRR